MTATIHVQRSGETFYIYPDEPAKSECGKPALVIYAPKHRPFVHEAEARQWFEDSYAFGWTKVIWV